MRSLFENEEKEMEINQLKVDLISRFYPFKNEQILKYQPVISFDGSHLMNNELIQWDYDLLDSLTEKINWKELWKLKNIRLDLDFFKKYESKINFNSILLSRNIDWSDELLTLYGDNFDLNRIIKNKPISTFENLKRYKFKLDWSKISQIIEIDFTEEILNEFSNYWDWKKLSANRHLPITVEFIKTYQGKLDFDELSMNPRAIEVILQHPTLFRWNWYNVILNPAISYNEENFDFIFYHFERQFEFKTSSKPTMNKKAFPFFLYRLFCLQRNDLDYFLKSEFIEYLPWNELCKFCNLKMSMDFISEHKGKLNFKEPAFIRCQKDIVTNEFIEKNLDLFDSMHYSFYYLDLTIEIIKKLNDEINWQYLSSCDNLDWNWDFLTQHHDDLCFDRLSQNKGIYDKLVIGDGGEETIISFLENQMRDS